MTSTYRLKRQKRERKIYNERQRLMSLPGAMATAVDEVLSKKYRISRSTICRITRRCTPTTPAS